MANYRIDKYTDRFFAVYSDNDLVAVTVYKKGAVAVKDRLEKLEAKIEKLESQLQIQNSTASSYINCLDGMKELEPKTKESAGK